MTKTEWGSRLGFILAAAGSAIGLGAIWKFPYVAAHNGGGAFLFIFLAICLTLGLVLMVSEIALGRATREGAVSTFKKLAGGCWPIIGYLGVLSCFMILAFYSVVGGWTIAYIVKAINGSLALSDPKMLGDLFAQFMTDPFQPILYHAIFALLTLGIVVGGVQRGIESLSKVLMPTLFILMLVLIVRAMTLPKALEGVFYFITPDFSKVTGQMLVDALGLAFFSLSLGLGIMVTYGSYVQKKANIISSSLWVIALTISVCLLAGFMVLPAVFAFGFNPSAGPGLTFITMPAVFAHMPMGSFFAVLFFFLLLIAALTSSISLLEVITRFCMDEIKMRRIPAAISMTTLTFLLGIPASLSLGIWSGYTFLGMGLFDILDTLTSKVFMPLCELLLAIFVGWKAWKLVQSEIGVKAGRWDRLLRFFVMIIIPILIACIMIAGLKPLFE